MSKIIIAATLVCLSLSLMAECPQVINALPPDFSAGRLISHIVQMDAEGSPDVDCLAAHYNKQYVVPAPFSLHAQYYYNHRANHFLRRSAYDSAFHYTRLALKCDSILSDSFYLATDLGLLANIHLMKGEFDKSINYYEQSLSVLNPRKHPANALSLLSNLGVAYLKTDYYETAMQYFRQALEYGQYADTPYGRRSRHVTLLNIGIIHKKQEDFPQAIQAFHSLLDTARLYEYPYLSYLAHFNIAQVYRQTGSEKNFLSHLDTAWNVAIEHDFNQHYLLTESISHAHEQKNWKKFIDYLEKYRTYYEEDELECDPEWAIWNSRLLLEYNTEPAQALFLLSEGLNCTDFYTEDALDLYALRSEVFQKLGSYKKALKNLTKSKVISDSLARRTNLRILADATTSYRVAEYQQMLDQKEKEKAWLRKRANYTNALALGLGAVLLLISFLFYFYRQKMQYKKEALEARRQQLETLNKSKQEELARQKQRLLTQSVQSSQLKAKVLDACERYRRNSAMLTRKVEMAFNEQPVWENFLLDFNQNYPGFIDRILQEYPDTSKRQLQYVVLIALGFSNQEISDMLFVTPGGVEKAKSRLARQFQINDKRRLSQEIMNLFFRSRQEQ
ncbi:tetratricopeptide repeat protein [Phaeodactylibacter xiamenensis]|uniref:tetratricopeptide repeat protein n=1 Tax=Phaeodactylibacter xiamenensis TaxID=1524460 RepID=UPI003BA99B85